MHEPIENRPARKPIEDYLAWKIFVKFNRGLLLFCALSALLTIFASVVMRYVFKSDLHGMEEIVTLATMWLYFMGGVDGSYEDSHIDADVMGLLIKSDKVKHIIKIVVKVICLAVSVVFAKWGIDYFKWCVATGGVTQTLKIPMLLSRIPLSIAFILMVFFNAYHLINVILNRTPKIEGAEPKDEAEKEENA